MSSKITWVAIYKDGSIFSQIDNGVEHSSEAIDRKNLQSLTLYKDGFPVVRQSFEPGQRLIFRRRVVMPSSGNYSYIYLLGWQKTIAGENIQHISYIFEDTGAIEMAGRFIDSHPYDSPKWLPCEEQCVEDDK